MTKEEKYEEAVNEQVNAFYNDLVKEFNEAVEEYEESYSIENMKEHVDEYIDAMGYEPWYSMSDFDEIMGNESPVNLVQRALYGDFNASDDYFSFNGYGNLISNNEGAIGDIDEDEFLDWCKEQDYSNWSDFFRYAEYILPEDTFTEEDARDILEDEGELPDEDDFEDDDE